MDKRFDDLIKSGWKVIDSGFDIDAFHEWRQNASLCVDALLAPDQTDTKRSDGFKTIHKPTHAIFVKGARRYVSD